MIFSSALPLNLGSASSACIFIAEEEAEEAEVKLPIWAKNCIKKLLFLPQS